MKKLLDTTMMFDNIATLSVFVADNIKYIKTGAMTARRTSDNKECVFYPQDFGKQISGVLKHWPLISTLGNDQVTIMIDGSVWSNAEEAMKHYHPLTPVCGAE